MLSFNYAKFLVFLILPSTRLIFNFLSFVLLLFSLFLNGDLGALGWIGDGVTLKIFSPGAPTSSSRLIYVLLVFKDAFFKELWLLSKSSSTT